MRKRFNKLVAAFLAVVLCVAFVPLAAIAANPDGEGVESLDPAITEIDTGGDEGGTSDLGSSANPDVSDDVASGNEELGVEPSQDQEPGALTDDGDEATEEDAIDPQAEEIDDFTALKEAIENGSVSSVEITDRIVATDAIHVTGELTIGAAEGVTISRDSQTHSIFVVETGGSLTLNGVKLVGNNEDYTSRNTSSYVSPVVVDSGHLTLENSSLISNFAAQHGGAITAKSGTNVVIDNSVISNNKACNYNSVAYGGGIQADGANVILRNNATLQSNIANASASDPTWRCSGGIGGGINLTNSASLEINSASLIGNEAGDKKAAKGVCRAGAGGGIAVNRHCNLVMNNGLISENGAYCSNGDATHISATYGGGGIYIGSAFSGAGEIYSDKVKLNSGTISNNYSYSVGGGIYVHTNSELNLSKALITGNNNETPNGSMGGGVYVCQMGSGAFFSTNGCLITKNRAVAGSYGHADDVEFEYLWDLGFGHASTRQQDGTKIDWYLDERNNRYSSSSDAQPIEDLQTYIDQNRPNKNVSLHSEVSEIKGSYNLNIINNSADIGGGVACNGYLYLGEQKDIELVLKKEWVDVAEPDMPESIIAKVYNKGIEIDTVTLSAENNWQTTLIDLPYDGVYTVKEVDEDGNEVDEFEVSYNYGEEGLESLVPPTPHEEYTITITNTAVPSEGELTITKSFNGSASTMVGPNGSVGSATAVFHVEGFLPASADDSENGSAASDEAVEGEEGSADQPQKETFTDEDGKVWVKFYDNFVGINISDESNSVTLTNLPVGALFKVTEKNYDQSGFTVEGSLERIQILERSAHPVITFNYVNNIDDEEHPNQGVVNRYSFTKGNKDVDPHKAA